MLTIPKRIYEEMIDYCKSCLPQEACGILGGEDCEVKEFYKMRNIEASSISYTMDASEQFMVMKDLRSKNLSLTAIFHSHPSSPAFPSPKDLRLAFYEDSFYIIISLMDNEPQTKAFLIKNQEKIKEIEILIK